MKKISLFVLLLSLLSIVLVGCQSKVSKEVSDVTIKKVSISKSSGFDKFNSDDFFAVYEDK